MFQIRLTSYSRRSKRHLQELHLCLLKLNTSILSLHKFSFKESFEMYFLLFLACFPVIYKTWHTKFFIGQNVRHLKKISSLFFDKKFFLCFRKFLSLKSGLSLSKTKVLAAKGSQREIWNPSMGYYDMGNRKNNISEVNIFYFSTIIVNIP